jgi:hypothetical protein
MAWKCGCPSASRRPLLQQAHLIEKSRGFFGTILGIGGEITFTAGTIGRTTPDPMPRTNIEGR